jgi:predicted DNA-binding protein with PD1-like motif
VALDPSGRKIHAHAVVGRRDGSTRGGHLKQAYVFPTLEVVVEETPGYLRRRYDPETGLTLIALDDAEG